MQLHFTVSLPITLTHFARRLSGKESRFGAYGRGADYGTTFHHPARLPEQLSADVAAARDRSAAAGRGWEITGMSGR